jgi:hypothetical protein
MQNQAKRSHEGSLDKQPARFDKLSMGEICCCQGAFVEPTKFPILSLSKDAANCSKRIVTQHEAKVLYAWNIILTSFDKLRMRDIGAAIGTLVESTIFPS